MRRVKDSEPNQVVRKLNRPERWTELVYRRRYFRTYALILSTSVFSTHRLPRIVPQELSAASTQDMKHRR